MNKSVITYLKKVLKERQEYDKHLDLKGPLMYNADLMTALEFVIKHLKRKQSKEDNYLENK
jgi:hypothetical protein